MGAGNCARQAERKEGGLILTTKIIHTEGLKDHLRLLIQFLSHSLTHIHSYAHHALKHKIDF